MIEESRASQIEPICLRITTDGVNWLNSLFVFGFQEKKKNTNRMIVGAIEELNSVFQMCEMLVTD